MHSAIVGGSSAGRVLNCPASVKLAQAAPEQPQSAYAAEGTALHAIMEQALLNAQEPSSDVVGLHVEGVQITQEHWVDKLLPAWDATQEAFRQFNVTEYEPESRVHFRTLPGVFGTCDVLGLAFDGTVVLLDYKFGDGVLVSPVDSAQLKFYAAAAAEDAQFSEWFTHPDQRIVLGIIQPAQEPPLQTWETTLHDVKAFQAELVLALARAEKPDVQPHPGDWCRWCPAAPTCPAKTQLAAETVAYSPVDAVRLADNMRLADQLEDWIKQVRNAGHFALENGVAVPGYKLVQKRATRKWVDEGAALDKLKRMRSLAAKDYSTVKLCTPPQLEKICKAKGVDFAQFEEYFDSVSSGTTVAPDTDPRPGIVMQRERVIPEHLALSMKTH